ncbi:hypothetical protein DC498_10665 [Terrimonas sp.]|uniref:DUF4407 domain-containing protein n=1 Tax=Terrimonas sp. TaxID=1914338 RepID=UPI000D50D194|nr:DUF4407 domain-containing protein [Terrimonas sp.]PVD52180.1 hypothetical protein DC498_10665 [Terrimonas sp.]
MNYKSDPQQQNTLFTSPSNPEPEPSSWDKTLWWMAAADASLMKDCGPDKFRYTVIGYTVMATWLFATLAWGYFFSTLFDDILIILPAAVFFGFVILTIDRGLIAGLNSNGGKNKWLSLSLRLLLALTIGFFISQPVVLMLFEKDINAHLPVVKEKKIAAYTKQVHDENAVTLQQARTEIERIRNEQKVKEQEISDLKNAYIRETDGTGGSGKIGEYTIARVKKMAYLKSEEDLIAWKRGVQPALDSALAKEKATEAVIQQRIVEFDKGLTDGFLTRIETLDDLMIVHPPVKYRYRLVIMLIMMIELMPLLTKLMMPSGLYEEKVQDAIQQRKLLWQTERAALKEVERSFYETALTTDKQLQADVMHEINELRRKQAEEAFSSWKQNPGKVRQFWEQLKSRLLYFNRN